MTYHIEQMTVNGRENCMAVDGQKPVFAWQIKGEVSHLLQKAYRIVVKNRENEVWDSGKVESCRNFGAVYEGEELQPESTYTWKLTVYDQYGNTAEGQSYFETALMSHDLSAWEGAEWIGNNDLPLETSILSVFKMNCTVKLNENSQEAGFLFAGDDARLLDRTMNLEGLQNEPGESYCAAAIDVSGMDDQKPAYLRVYRRGFSAQDTEEPFASYEISASLINRENRYEPHTIYMECECGQVDLMIDGETDQYSVLGPLSPNPFMNMERRLNLNPVGRGQDYICYINAGKVGLYEKTAGAEISSFEIRNFRKPCNVLYKGLPAVNVLSDVSHGANTMLVSSVDVHGKIAKARVYATARGIYELWMNGRKVSEDYLTPGMSQYDEHHYYQIYDVTDLVQEGENRIGSVLAEGWFSGYVSFIGSNWNYYGDRSSLLLKMVVEYEDGTREVMVSDPSSWKMNQDGPVRYASIFQGEMRDLGKEHILEQFTCPGYSLEGWIPAEKAVCDETTSCLGEDTPVFLGSIEPALDYADMKLCAQPDQSVRVTKSVKAIGMSEPVKGHYIYDMGQNIAGVEEIVINGKEGQKVTLRFAEVLYPDMEEYAGKQGTMMMENIRAAIAEDHFILREGRQVLKPSFTYHGYRYVEITGIEEPLPLADVRGLSVSSAEVTASFRCSDPMITRLYENISWSLRDNFISIPTDCPQRNERMGWSGDLSVFSRTAVYMSMSDPFLARHMQSMVDTQFHGRFSDISPIGGGFGGILWGSAGMTVPWEMYLQYGDTEILNQMYDSMKLYMEHLSRQKDDRGILTEGPLGDWLGPEISKNESEYLWMCYYLYDLKIMQKCCELLEKKEEQAVFSEEYTKVHELFIRTYFDEETGMTVYSDYKAAMSSNNPMMPVQKEKAPEQTASGRYIMDTQTSYAVVLGLDLLEGELRKKAAEHLKNACDRENTDDLGEVRPPYSLMTGFIGTAWISQALSDNGYDQTAWKLLKQTEYPSWLYPVWNGATTIWERLNSFTLDRGFGGNNSMNSFNHYSFGAVGAWMLAYAGGVRRGEEPGTFMIAPVPDPDGEVSWAETSVQTVQGEYKVKWNRTAKGWKYELDLPAGRITSVILPAGKDTSRMLGECCGMEGLMNVQPHGNTVCFDAMPGRYVIG